jgi:uncharacterized membrane protein
MKILDKNHARNTFLAGLFAVIPLAVTGYLIYLVEINTAEITRQIFGRYVPLVGAMIVLMLVYLLGMIVRSVFGKWILRTIDRIITRIPVLKELYNAWKQISFTPGGGEGMYAKVVLIPAGGAVRTKLMGFTSGVPCAPGSTMMPVFVPNVPNPILGRIYFVDQADIVVTPLTTDEAFKILLSSANYVPGEIVQQLNVTQ